MNEMDTYELTEFNLKDAIILDEKCGLIKITRSDDGRLILVCDGSYDLIPQEGPSERPIASVDSALGFTLDIGIRKEMKLTSGSGYYFGIKFIDKPQSVREVSQADYDGGLLEKIVSTIDSKFHSTYPPSQRRALRLNHLLETYNHARLLYPHFYSDSYLKLISILDSLNLKGGASNFGLWVCEISGTFNREVYTKICDMGALRGRIDLAESIISRIPNGDTKRRLRNLSRYKRFVYVCFYAAYQYRSKFVHQGFPIPRTVIERSSDEDNGLAYLNPTVAQSHMQIFRPSGYQPGDDLDIHSAIRLEKKQSYNDFEEYFQLLPSWHWLKSMVRLSLVREINRVAALK